MSTVQRALKALLRGPKETPRSLGMYLRLVAIWYGGAALALGHGFGLFYPSDIVVGHGIAYTIDWGVGILFALGYLYAGLRTQALLATGGTFILRLLWASVAYQGLGVLMMLGAGVVEPRSIFQLIVWFYLIFSVRRLSHDARLIDSTPAPASP